MNEEDGAYKQALEQLYGIAYTLKMSYKSDYRIEGFFECVVPPLEGLWWAENGGIDYSNKDDFCFISMIRLPGDPRKTSVDKLKTVIRYPIR